MVNLPLLSTIFIITLFSRSSYGAPSRGLGEGLTWGSNLCSDIDYVMSSTKGITWTYSWGATPSNTSCSAFTNNQFEFVPMIWGANSISNPIYVNSLSKYLLGFNEPNAKGQSNLTPTEAANLWPKVLGIAKKYNLSLVSPATAGCDTTWLKQFFSACTNCEKDIVAIATHSYDCNPQGLTTCINSMTKEFNKPLWITEFNCGNGMFYR